MNTDHTFIASIAAVIISWSVCATTFNCTETYQEEATAREAIKAGLVQQTDEQGNVIWTNVKSYRQLTP